MKKLRSKIFIILNLLFVSSIVSQAATFVVTSNADAGSGSLREALQNSAANGNAIVDYITFNLPGTTATDFSITLVTQLPDVSSGLIIDGTSQPGGFSFTQNTKVKISSPDNNIAFTIFKGVNIVNFQFYGLYIYDFSDEVVSRPLLQTRIIVDLKKSKDIIVGDAEKGNLLRGGNINNMIFEDCQNISVKGNLFGWDPSERFTYHNPGIHFNNCDRIYIGGDEPKEKNTFFLSVFINVDKSASLSNAEIKGNNFGVLENENNPLGFIQGHANFIDVRNTSGLENVYPTVNLIVKDNVFWNFGVGVHIHGVLGEQNIIHNYFGITRALVPMIRNGGSGTFVYSEFVKGKVRVTDNYITTAYRGISTFLSENIQISNNRYSCIFDPVYKNEAPRKALTPLTVGNFTISNSLYSIKGTSDPHAVIEVYDSEQCYAPTCRPRSRIGLVIADDTGNWEFSSSTNPITYFFSATSGAQSSEFKSFNITENINIEKAKCNEFGRVTGLEAYLPLNPRVRDSEGKEIPISGLKALPVGKYTITLDGACATSTFEIQLITPVAFGQVEFEITDNTCFIINSKILIKKFNGKVPTTFQWKDADGKIVAETKDLNDQPSGIYKFYGKDENSCEQYIGSYEIKTIPAVILLKDKLVVTEDICGSSSGSISKLSFSGGVGPFRYQWLDEGNKEVGTDLDVSNLKAGVYRLIIKDKYCSGYFEGIEVPFVGKTLVPIEQEDISVCGPGQFVIQTASIANALTYNLYDEDRILLQKNSSGSFSFNITKPQKLMLSYSISDCESIPTPFSIIFKQPEIKVPSAFSPNGDGINDTWTIRDFLKYPDLSVSIYNRLGSLVYKGGQKTAPFDGKLNGNELAVGVYYYVIKLLPSCPIISGSLTLIR